LRAGRSWYATTSQRDRGECSSLVPATSYHASASIRPPLACGFGYAAFVIDAFAWLIPGWKVTGGVPSQAKVALKNGWLP
jgi:hypothetical protein